IRKANSQNNSQIENKLKLFGNFRNSLGIAAGLDKNAEYVDCLAALDIGFIEVGTVTPRPQPGNPKPRIFRNRKERYLINRLGFNNDGVDNLVNNLKKRKSSIPIGISIGKNFDTPNDNAFIDYLICLERVYEYASYIAVNISSPNTKNLRDLSSKEYLDSLLKKLKLKRDSLSGKFGYKPFFVKISPDEDLQRIDEICKIILANQIEGIICSNTTIVHHDNRQGGLSGAPLKKKSTDILNFVRKRVGDDVILIASGGVMSAPDYQEKINSGADLVQIYTGFIFEGPKLIKDIISISN
ncbi:quinone-dependent dihydroorotate dehydrogenase, partial [Gammaproteobacteria bacterium]|nr:quinone-dependent dihydroorotate dehydrogenase [Gammaproteobacteria bacterium]